MCTLCHGEMKSAATRQPNISWMHMDYQIVLGCWMGRSFGLHKCQITTHSASSVVRNFHLYVIKLCMYRRLTRFLRLTFRPLSTMRCGSFQWTLAGLALCQMLQCGRNHMCGNIGGTTFRTTPKSWLTKVFSPALHL